LLCINQVGKVAGTNVSANAFQSRSIVEVNIAYVRPVQIVTEGLKCAIF
jgi:hypothetical protein